MANKVICKYCSAKIEESEPQCPYCGSVNEKGAEAEYLNRLENVREELEGLEEVPKEEIRKEIHRQKSFLKKVFLIILIVAAVFAVCALLSDFPYQTDNKAGFLWKQENVPVMDELYRQGSYEEALKIYREGQENSNVSLYNWEHSDFFDVYETILYIQGTLEYEAEGYELTEAQCMSLFFDEWNVIESVMQVLEEEEKAKLREYTDAVLQDFDERWNLSEEDYERFYNELEENGFISFSSCAEYIDKWYKE